MTRRTSLWPRLPLRPSQDDFHAAPDDLRDLPLGTVIRSREVRLGFLGLVPQGRLRATQLAFRSQDLDERAEVTVATVISTGAIEPGSAPRIIGYQCAIDAISDRCFPSYNLRLGAVVPGALPPLELLLINWLAEQGYVVVVTDHEGLTGVFGAPREPGYRVLDALRATLRHFDLSPRSSVGLVGYSGGGMATAWAAEMAPSHAPELNLVGAAMGSPVGDPGQAFVKLNSTLFAGLPALVVAGLTRVHVGLADLIDQHASVDGHRRLREVADQTTVGAVLRHHHDDFDDFLDVPLADMLAEQDVIDLFADLRMGRGAPTCPVLVVQSTHDQVIDVDDVDTLVENYVEAGGDVRYVRDRLSEHIGLMLTAMPYMAAWLGRCFDGAERTTGTGTVWSVSGSRNAVAGYAGMLGSVVRLGLGLAGLGRRAPVTDEVTAPTLRLVQAG